MGKQQQSNAHERTERKWQEKQNIEGLSVRRLINFCEDAASEVEDENSKFYFEQMIDYFKNHYSPKRGLESASKVLGL